MEEIWERRSIRMHNLNFSLAHHLRYERKDVIRNYVDKGESVSLENILELLEKEMKVIRIEQFHH